MTNAIAHLTVVYTATYRNMTNATAHLRVVYMATYSVSKLLKSSNTPFGKP